ncbi:CRTAC1 family protein [Pontibacter sp. G13]|uniref:CRTAC1 family protein n=1 Tax=Pontibacter sp. G13 TaxID=3074898 RepID=UPI0028892A31|nr:CRTAC1 family protein [Pontibacter sp. G13]WNJ17036.1 CRTAC1 family protein [Pontibacter sp. G13]
MMRKLLWILVLLPLACSLHAQPFTVVNHGPQATDTTNTNGVSWVDVDGDGDLDLFLTNAQNPFGYNILYRNDGGERFERWNVGEITGLQAPTFGHAWGDFNNDGLPDLYVVNGFTQMGSQLYQNLGHGQFKRIEQYGLLEPRIKGFHAAWGDYDLDGWLDLFITHPAKFVGIPITSNFLFHNQGDGTFSPVENTLLTRIVAPFTNATWCDYDRDGDPDLFVGSGPADGSVAPDFLFKNEFKEKGNITFSRISEPIWARDSMDGQVWNWIDYDNDGDLDLYVSNYGGSQGGRENHLYRAEADTFVRVREGAIVEDRNVSLANIWADFDNDGYLDCFVTNGNNQQNRLYQNRGDGTFTTLQTGHLVEDNRNTWGASAGDFDNDGDIDLFVANKKGYISGPGDVNFLYRNDQRSGNHWISIQLEGTQSNKQGVGAKIYLTAFIHQQSMTQYREVGSNSTFLGNNDIRAHFGLGDAPLVDKIEVHWPSGQIDTFKDIPLDQFFIIREGSGN